MNSCIRKAPTLYARLGRDFVGTLTPSVPFDGAKAVFRISQGGETLIQLDSSTGGSEMTWDGEALSFSITPATLSVLAPGRCLYELTLVLTEGGLQLPAVNGEFVVSASLPDVS